VTTPCARVHKQGIKYDAGLLREPLEESDDVFVDHPEAAFTFLGNTTKVAFVGLRENVQFCDVIRRRVLPTVSERNLSVERSYRHSLLGHPACTLDRCVCLNVEH
jgi:hypothetical protein